MTEVGLRERQKLARRQRIVEAAVALFAERGFEAVPVTEIAQRAEVSPATVFNYFPTKEDLIYDGMAAFHAALLGAVRDRRPGVSVPAAFREFLLQPRGLLVAPDPGAREQLAVVARVIRESPALQARERQEAERSTAALAELVAAELVVGPLDLRPWVLATALVGVSRAMSRAVQQAAIDGRLGPEFTAELMTAGTAALIMIEQGCTA
ncbi:helix-turn-helix domain-containing protein [Pseudofrankia sp. BMG5.37]|uniref:TetR/AcrR family transcriptional regulator n=1 Tax=Pseudofrankia sp. BMG5.37 TaxID=3050035 RepID=UPI002895D97D|nr:helix-turn-helix domain-containing protein [Pseudofrankia sp. BMG5.37]MDT3442129.1 helix-turn-helix domain-containing protein [Pseudofrankia sp. BMG5.37]